MKKTFFRILPLVAAVMLAASCGKDGDSDVNINAPEPVVTPDPTQTTVGDGFVEIPFSIKVNDGNSLSKVALNGATKAINFEPEDVETVKLSVAGAIIEGISGTLDLSKDDDDNYSFSGKITVPEGQKDAFSSGAGIDIVGTFTQDKGNATSSAESFKDLWDNCAHTYKAEFKSTDGSLTLVDQNIYFYVATYKNEITINGKAVTSENQFAKGSYYAYQYDESTTVTGLPSDKKIKPSKLYTIGKAVTEVSLDKTYIFVEVGETITLTATAKPDDATNRDVSWLSYNPEFATVEGGEVKGVAVGETTIRAEADDIFTLCTVRVVPEGWFVDLGLSDGTKWAADNITGTNPDGEGTDKNGVWYYTFDAAQKFGKENLPTGGDADRNSDYPNTDFLNLWNQCYWEKVTDEGGDFKGYNVFKSKDKSKDHGFTKGTTDAYEDSENHIFLPAEGFCGGGGGPFDVGRVGRYWSSTVFDGNSGFMLYFGDGDVVPEGNDNRRSEYPVRAVWRSN